MANQDPQPEIYEVISTFDTALTPNTGVAGSQVVTNINTFQANNEVVRVYGIKINVTDNAAVPANLDPATAGNCDYSVTIQAGPAQVPSFTFRMRPTWVSTSRVLIFPTPVLILFKQPFQVTVTNNSGSGTVAGGRIVSLELISELGIQKVAC
jgi:hypothetical protein